MTTPPSFVASAIRRKKLFLGLSAIGVIAGIGLLAWALTAGEENFGLRFALAILVLLNARQNLRQYRYANALEALVGMEPDDDS